MAFKALKLDKVTKRAGVSKEHMPTSGTLLNPGTREKSRNLWRGLKIKAL